MMLMIHIMPKIFIMLPVLILVPLAMIAILVLFIKLCYKRPLVAGVVILLPVLLLASFFVIRQRPFEHWRETSTDWNLSSSETGGAGVVQINSNEASVNPTLPQSENAAVIWTPGIEDEFEANIYPSKLSAVRSLGLHIDRAIQQVQENIVSPGRIVLLQGAQNHQLVEELGRAIKKVLPQTNYFIEPETAAVQDNEVAILLNTVDVQTQPVAWASNSGSNLTSGTIEATALEKGKQCTINARFIEKPWVEDFSAFLNSNPNSHFIIAKSSESCMSEAEANNQAVQNACAQVAAMIGQGPVRRSGVPVSFARPVTPADIVEGGFILDRFVQSFVGTAGKIWRQALLLDTSTNKLKNLARQKAAIANIRRKTFAGMFFSVAGLILLIILVYAFLNAATKGYYTWSLRIAGAVFALVLIILLLV
jgi:hypothetical protein